jgi:hypothetical protein
MLYYELLMAIGHAVRQHYRAAYQQLVENCDDNVTVGNALSLLVSADDWVNDDLIVRDIQMNWEWRGPEESPRD